MIIPIQTMPSGWHNATIYAGDLITTARFRVDLHEWTLGPTPTQYIKYLSDGSIAPVIVTVTVPPVIITQEVDRWHTATPTPDITDALGQKIDYPYKPGDKLEGGVAIFAALVIAGIVLLRGSKWK
jgi:hypothetical protein